MKILKELLPYLIIIVVVLIIRTFIITPVRVVGSSMYPTLENKELLLLKKYDKNIKRFDIIVLKYDDSKLVKRVIGLPGEHVSYKDNKLYINGEEVEDVKLTIQTLDFDMASLGVEVIPEDYYFVMGDNRNNSTDSRIIGLVSKYDILGKTNFRIYPFNKIGSIK